MLNNCPECGGLLSSTATFCPHCGYQPKPIIPRAKRTRKKLPNGFGSVRKLSGRRTYPYGAYPPINDYHDNGSAKSVPAIGYYKTYNEAYQALCEYNKNPFDLDSKRATFAEVYKVFMLDKFPEGHTLSKSALQGYEAAFGNSKAIHDIPFSELRAVDFQNVFDDCKLKSGSKALLRNLFRQMSKFALARDYIQKDYATLAPMVVHNDDEHGVPLSDDEIHTLITSGDSVGVLMLYTGMRIGELKTIVRVNEHFYRGGLKTKAGKNRLIPIHPAIQNIDFDKDHFSEEMYRRGFKERFPGHTPHDLRHTATWLMQKYRLDDLAMKMILGHTRGNDIEQTVYGHRTEEQLYAEILKIPTL